MDARRDVGVEARLSPPDLLAAARRAVGRLTGCPAAVEGAKQPSVVAGRGHTGVPKSSWRREYRPPSEGVRSSLAHEAGDGIAGSMTRRGAVTTAAQAIPHRLAVTLPSLPRRPEQA